jgi:hypothetical protein
LIQLRGVFCAGRWRAHPNWRQFASTKILVASAALPRGYHVVYMLTINITWEYFLGIMGTLIALAYYTNGRFTRVETNYEWLADTVRDLAIKTENISTRAFESSSPLSLTATGEQLLRDSGLKSYMITIETN